MAAKKIFKYNNGATLVYYQTNEADKTEITFGWRISPTFEGGGEKTGLAHVVEHMSAGAPTENLSRDEVRKKIKTLWC